MSVQENEAIARADVETYNARNLDGFTKLFSPDAEIVNVPTGVFGRGPKAARDGTQALLTAFPDSKAEILNVIAGERSAVVEYLARGTHTGALAARAGTLPPTGRKVEMRICDVMDIQNGKVTAIRTYWDMYGLMVQLGLIPATAPIH